MRKVTFNNHNLLGKCPLSSCLFTFYSLAAKRNPFKNQTSLSVWLRD